MTYQITAGHFCAGLNTSYGKVTSAAPIIAYMCGWNIVRVRKYCDRKGWKFARAA